MRYLNSIKSPKAKKRTSVFSLPRHSTISNRENCGKLLLSRRKMKKLTERILSTTIQTMRVKLGSQQFQFVKDKKERPKPQLPLLLLMSPNVHQEISLGGC
jgi:hypothetical protein